MLVEEVMTPRPVTIRRDATVHQALVSMAQHGVTSLPVLDSGDRVCGVVSEADALRDRVVPDRRVREIPRPLPPDPPRLVQDVMTPEVLTVGPRSELAEAVELMLSTAVKSLPVVDRERRLVGILSRSDVVRVLARPDDEVRGEVEALFASLERHDWRVGVLDGVVTVTGPATGPETALADAVALSVPGVVRVHVEAA